MLQKLERLRKIALAGEILTCLVALGVGVAIVVLSVTGDGDKWYYYGITPYAVAIVGIVVAYLLGHRVFYKGAYERFSSQYKQTLMKDALNQVVEEIDYQPGRGLSKEGLAQTGLIRFGNVYRSTDYISGRYHGMMYEQAEVLSQNFERVSGSAPKNDLYFDGKWVSFDMDCRYEIFVCIRQKEFKEVVRPFKLYYTESAESEKVDLEDEAFLREFDVYAKNPENAVQLLTQPVRDQLRTLRDFECGQLLVCLCGGRLHVAVNCGEDFLKVELLKKVTDETSRKILEELELITTFADMVAERLGQPVQE